MWNSSSSHFKNNSPMIKIKYFNFHSTFILPYFTYTCNFYACITHWNKKHKVHRVYIQGKISSKFHSLVIENGTKSFCVCQMQLFSNCWFNDYWMLITKNGELYPILCHWCKEQTSRSFQSWVWTPGLMMCPSLINIIKGNLQGGRPLHCPTFTMLFCSPSA